MGVWVASGILDAHTEVHPFSREHRAGFFGTEQPGKRAPLSLPSALAADARFFLPLCQHLLLSGFLIFAKLVGVKWHVICKSLVTRAAEYMFPCIYGPLVFVFYTMPVGVTSLFLEDRLYLSSVYPATAVLSSLGYITCFHPS